MIGITAESTWNELRTKLEGPVLAPADIGYDDARLAWDRKVVQRPAVIVIARSAADVQEAVSYARAQGLGVAVQATGHGNVRPADDCLLILTHELDGMTVDPLARTARLEAGVKWGAVLAAAQQHGLAPLLGSSPTVGAIGYTLGGGLGWLGRQYGLSADNVLRYELVTGDGRLRHVSAEEEPDLFWGLRGGGGTLGVVTAMTIRLFPVTEVYAGNLYYPAEMAADVFRHYRDWVAEAPEALTSSVLVMNYPPVPDLPDFLRGQSFAIVRGCFCGPLAQGESLLRHWREWQTPTVDHFGPIPFGQAATISNDPVDPMPAFNSGAWLRDLSDAALDAIIAHALGHSRTPPLVFAEIRHAGGAIRRVPPEAAVFGNRDAEYLLCLVGVTPSDEVHRHVAAHAGRLMDALQPSLTGGVYMNFLQGAESQQRIRDGLAAGGYERLAALKKQFDPDNLFRFGFNVAPAD